jgi:hypothetical protein
MKKLFASVLLSSSLIGFPAFAETPEMTREIYTSVGDGFGLFDTTFKAQAIKTTSLSGTSWMVRIIWMSDIVSASARYTGPDFIVNLEDAKKMLSICQKLLTFEEEAKSNPADAYEKRIGVYENLDLVYRHYNRPEVLDEFWFAAPGTITSTSNQVIVVPKDIFKRFIKALELAISKAESGK